MELYILIAACVLFAGASVTVFLKDVHMFQLNSYGVGTHMKWMMKNFSSVIYNIFALIFLGMSLFSDFVRQDSGKHILILHAIFAAVFAVLIFANRRRKKAKTPLVFTARVKRMLVTYLILALICIALAFVLPLLGVKGLSYAVLLGFYALSPFMLFLANLINAPIEAAVRNYYLKDAKRILRDCPDLKIIGITGSYGKTSMKHFLTAILKQRYNVLMTPKNYNTPMGVTITVRGYLRGYHEIFVCEMGAKKKGEIKELCDIVHPCDGIVTSIGPQHLESFKSMENIISTKMALADEVKGGKAFLNIDNEYIAKEKREGAVTYGTVEGADYRGKVISVSKKGTEFSVTYPDGREYVFHTCLLGAHNVQNICGAVAIADSYGVAPDEIADGIASIKAIPHRLELIEKGGLTVIDDAYNSNPAGAKAALDALSYFEDYKILVTPGMVELGEKEEELNAAFGAQAAAVCDFVVLVGEKRAVPIKRGLIEAGYPEDKIFVAGSIGDAMNKVYSLTTDKKKVVLLENDLPDNY
ncbi:MAG: UDP-N-acetylmuramoyl-tripeptide--D-alanyl-D-alanine ligase [Ruminococcaceae bacterium]|nr:UDP-N-acetylmuramoyl-tripeptide--D-alanyl-D-alanine ligase [Oscillospiraceae bacterium]